MKKVLFIIFLSMFLSVYSFAEMTINIGASIGFNINSVEFENKELAELYFPIGLSLSFDFFSSFQSNVGFFFGGSAGYSSFNCIGEMGSAKAGDFTEGSNFGQFSGLAGFKFRTIRNGTNFVFGLYGKCTFEKLVIKEFIDDKKLKPVNNEKIKVGVGTDILFDFSNGGLFLDFNYNFLEKNTSLYSQDWMYTHNFACNIGVRFFSSIPISRKDKQTAEQKKENKRLEKIRLEEEKRAEQQRIQEEKAQQIENDRIAKEEEERLLKIMGIDFNKITYTTVYKAPIYEVSKRWFFENYLNKNSKIIFEDKALDLIAFSFDSVGMPLYFELKISKKGNQVIFEIEKVESRNRFLSWFSINNLTDYNKVKELTDKFFATYTDFLQKQY
ncbi:MAG: hypothetical protein ACRC4W_00925 [Treponemataceae bacterium]